MKRVHEHTLGNGLKLIGEESRSNQSAAMGFFVRTGARDEHPDESGVSHFLEHMMFKGTARRSALDITYELGNLAAQANAFTSEENTVYYTAVIPEYFARMQELLSDMLRPALEQGEFDTEKNVILEEIALYQDKPRFYFFERAMLEFFGVHPAGKSVLGTTESISALSRDQMQRYFDRRYAPNNMVFVVSGNIAWDRVVEDAERCCGAWRPLETVRETPPFRPEPIEREYRRKNLNQSHLLLGTGGCAAQSDDRYALGLLATIIGDSSGSRFYWELVESGLAESAGAESDERDGSGCFLAYAACEPARLPEVRSIMQRILADPLEFTVEDLELAKEKLATRIVMSGELPLGRLMALGHEWVYRTRIHSLRATVEHVRGITRADIERAVSRYGLSGWSEFRLLPE